MQTASTHFAEIIIHRKVYAQVPPKVEYSLTTLGRSLGPVFDKIYEWGVVYLRSFKPAKTTNNAT